MVLVGALGTYIAFRADETFRLIVEEREMRRNAADLLSALQDTEVGQRGFLVTRDPEFLEPYSAARTQVPALSPGCFTRPEKGSGWFFSAGISVTISCLRCCISWGVSAWAQRVASRAGRMTGRDGVFMRGARNQQLRKATTGGRSRACKICRLWHGRPCMELNCRKGRGLLVSLNFR